MFVEKGGGKEVFLTVAHLVLRPQLISVSMGTGCKFQEVAALLSISYWGGGS